MQRSLRKSYFESLARFVSVLPRGQISVSSSSCGFFGDVFATLNAIRFAEVCKLNCAVKWGEESLYHSPDIPNVWRHVFSQDCFNFSEHISRWSLTLKPHAGDFENYQGKTERESLCLAIGKFCSPNDRIVQLIQAFRREKFLNRPTLGVHIRRTDAANGFENRRTLGTDDYLKVVRHKMDCGKFDKVFVATDDASIIEQFSKEYGADALFTNSIRSMSGDSVHGHYDDGVNGNSAQKIDDVVIDAFLLSSCDFLVCGHSRVTLFAICQNAELGFSNLEKKILGIDRYPSLYLESQ